MQQHREVAKYAKALYAIAEKKGLIEETLKNLKLLYSINLSSAKFHLFLKSRRIDIKIKKEIISNIFSDILSSLEIDLLINLINNDSVVLLHLIIKQYKIICDHNDKVVKVIVSTAKELGDEEKIKLTHKIEKKLNKKIDLDNLLEPDIIGGAKFRIGNVIIDGSVSNRLRKLEKSLN
tara:strand:+ start:390 stop:923 length:534 start_codon:yes stop_codon:yes gene_type:complete